MLIIWLCFKNRSHLHPTSINAYTTYLTRQALIVDRIGLPTPDYHFVDYLNFLFWHDKAFEFIVIYTGVQWNRKATIPLPMPENNGAGYSHGITVSDLVLYLVIYWVLLYIVLINKKKKIYFLNILPIKS